MGTIFGRLTKIGHRGKCRHLLVLQCKNNKFELFYRLQNK